MYIGLARGGNTSLPRVGYGKEMHAEHSRVAIRLIGQRKKWWAEGRHRVPLRSPHKHGDLVKGVSAFSSRWISAPAISWLSYFYGGKRV